MSILISPNLFYACLIGVGIHLPNNIMKSPMLDQTEKNHCNKPDTDLMNLNESFNENNVLLSDENKVMIILYFYFDLHFISKTIVYINK